MSQEYGGVGGGDQTELKDECPRRVLSTKVSILI
jgi:hypothetical protein